jgi:hypothetical protein
MSLKLPDFETSAHEGGLGCQPHAPTAFTPEGNIPGTHFC